MDTSIRRGSWEMVAAMLISGTIGWFVLVSGVSVIEVVFWRCVIGGLTLLVVCALLGYLRLDLLSWTRLGLAMLSGVAIVGNWLLLFESYSRASIAISTAVYNVQPFMLVMLAAVFLGEKITVQKLAWLSVAFLGMLAIVTAHGDQPTGDDYLTGIALALGAALLYAIAALIIKRLKAVPPHLMALIQVTTGALLLAPLVPWNSLPATTSAWGALVTLGVVHTGVMYVLLYGAIQKLPTALTGALSFIYPIAAIFVDWFAFGHRLGWLQWFGVAAILLAAAGLQRGWWWPRVQRVSACPGK
ncbi:DMT family transporter [Pseudomonas extremorientalis]|uniref:EamA domain-containing membrane protein RarD n=1 Tax=Pseudomonas extremorientalis TaxID=169669 RepID=A0A1H0J2R8_9PSED|nr:DMT family transporter [Pseudomonas extremorientalis]KAB0515526.1 DMT family transporter [Pseudomonas extremorientalis]OIN12593.1 multidrug DMT transporter permease [Pseudomonas extremorientalis]UUN86022.1 DMT family transporter [Pseudomonas extremorientalis]WLG59577.1 DMT family transporter [Pseudomonas extremorientalis]SDO38005.1 EamA domain-containing membrane protein RarD [Pseudomonas extremorientalis]